MGKVRREADRRDTGRRVVFVGYVLVGVGAMGAGGSFAVLLWVMLVGYGGTFLPWIWLSVKYAVQSGNVWGIVYLPLMLVGVLVWFGIVGYVGYMCVVRLMGVGKESDRLGKREGWTIVVLGVVGCVLLWVMNEVARATFAIDGKWWIVLAAMVCVPVGGVMIVGQAVKEG